MEDHTGSGALELSEHGTIDREASTFLSEGSYQNVDWIGRWIVVPSYIIIMGTLVGTGWGYYERRMIAQTSCSCLQTINAPIRWDAMEHRERRRQI